MNDDEILWLWEMTKPRFKTSEYWDYEINALPKEKPRNGGWSNASHQLARAEESALHDRVIAFARLFSPKKEP
jgi:hypothetical protein